MTTEDTMRKDLFDDLVTSVKQMQAMERKRTRTAARRGGSPDVAALRARFGLSQSRFATLLGISTATLQNWEQGRREPDGPARVLLRVAERHPEALLAVARNRSG
jgi:putative transcriptional regulator